jgi:hypothetical protein
MSKFRAYAVGTKVELLGDLYAIQEYDELNKEPYVNIMQKLGELEFLRIRINGILSKCFGRSCVVDSKDNLVALI